MMKRVVLFISFVVLSVFSSCLKEKIDPQMEYYGKLKDLIKKEKATKVIHNDIFLGLKFGMTKEEVDQYLLNLYNKEKIKK